MIRFRDVFQSKLVENQKPCKWRRGEETGEETGEERRGEERRGQEMSGGWGIVVIQSRSLLIDYTHLTLPKFIKPHVYLACTLHYTRSCAYVCSCQCKLWACSVKVIPNLQTKASDQSLSWCKPYSISINISLKYFKIKSLTSWMSSYVSYLDASCMSGPVHK